jgi:hypothetical protein
MGAPRVAGRGMRWTVACLAACWPALACAQIPGLDFLNFLFNNPAADIVSGLPGGDIAKKFLQTFVDAKLGTNLDDPAKHTGPDPPASGQFYLHVIRKEKAKDEYWFIDLPFLNKYSKYSPSYYEPGRKCTDIWHPYTVEYRGGTYELAQDPEPPTLELTPFARVRTCDGNRGCQKCYQNSFCSGCFEAGVRQQHEFYFAITDDRRGSDRTVMSFGGCTGSLQIPCDAPTSCENGQYASDYYALDAVTQLPIKEPYCAECAPGTWNTCLTPLKGKCIW